MSQQAADNGLLEETKLAATDEVLAFLSCFSETFWINGERTPLREVFVGYKSSVSVKHSGAHRVLRIGRSSLLAHLTC